MAVFVVKYDLGICHVHFKTDMTNANISSLSFCLSIEMMNTHFRTPDLWFLMVTVCG